MTPRPARAGSVLLDQFQQVAVRNDDFRAVIEQHDDNQRQHPQYQQVPDDVVVHRRELLVGLSDRVFLCSITLNATAEEINFQRDGTVTTNAAPAG